MKTRTDITLATTRAHLRKPHPGVFINQMLVYWTSAAAVSAGWALILTLSNPLWQAALAGLAGAVSLPFLWAFFGAAFNLQADTTRVQRMVRGWMVSIVVVTAFGALFAPWWAALLAGAIGLFLSPLTLKATRQLELGKLKPLGLPAVLLPSLERLPQVMPNEVENALESAFRDWLHLRDLLGYSADSVLKASVDPAGIEADATRTLVYVLDRGPVVSKLIEVARERGDEQAGQVAETAVQRLRKVGDALHDAVAAAAQFAASERAEELHLLRARVDVLRSTADSVSVSVLDAEDPEAKWRQLGS